MSDTALPDWLDRWSFKALVPLMLALPVVRFLDFAPIDVAILVVLIEAILVLAVALEDERIVRAGVGVLALSAAGAVAVTPGDTFLTGLASLGMFSLWRAATSGQSWLDYGVADHGFRADAGTSDPATPAVDSVRTALADRPQTRRELWDTIDADADAIDEALDALQEDGAVTKAGSEFRLVESR